MRGVQIGRLRRTERGSLPPVAVREVLVNAVAHTDSAQSGAPIRAALFATHEIAEKIDLTPRAIRTRFGNLVARELVRHLGTGPQDPRRRYYVQE